MHIETIKCSSYDFTTCHNVALYMIARTANIMGGHKNVLKSSISTILTCRKGYAEFFQHAINGFVICNDLMLRRTVFDCNMSSLVLTMSCTIGLVLIVL